MIEVGTFQMADRVDRALLERHPAWSPYNERRDRDLIVGWGVAPADLDREIQRFEYCGTLLLFPVLEIDPLPPIVNVFVAARFTTASEASLPGYLLDPHAFGVFVDEKEFTFNRHLAGVSQAAAGKLAQALGADPEGLFPLQYATGLRDADGRALDGQIERPW